MSDLIIRIGGEGGEGVISSGDMIAQAAVRSGLNVLTFKTFPAEIRGGYAMYQTRFSDEKIMSEGSGFDVFCAFNQEALDKNWDSLKPGTVLVYDYPGGDIKEEVKKEGVIVYNVPMSQIAKKDLEMYRAKNMVALGALSHLFDISFESVQGTIKDKFGKKGEKVVNINLQAIEAGRAYVIENHKKTDDFTMGSVERDNSDQMIIAGNDAAGLGAIMAGCRFFSAYPITPATEVAIFMSKNLPKLKGHLVQAEDEIASLGNVLGASYAGVKTMTATSGPGLSLMQELIGLGSMAELPFVIVDVQRGGPSTGLPTKHEQSDLFLAAHGSHGDTSRVVLSPENVKDIVDLMVTAFNVAEKYQIPVLVLSDGSLGFRTENITRPDPSSYKIVDREVWDGKTNGDGPFLRYKLNESGVSAMSIPGQPGGEYIATGLEHEESSKPGYNPELHTAMEDKRFHKLDDIEDFIGETETWGDQDATLGVIAWGSTIGVAREAVKLANDEGVKVKALFPKLVWPLPLKAIDKFAEGCDKILIPEVNKQGQLAELIQGKTHLNPIRYNIYGGLPFSPAEILEKIKEVNNG